MEKLLREIKPGELFRLAKRGVVWKKVNDQGMNDCVAYITTIVKTNTRCQRLGYKHRYEYNDKRTVHTA